MSHFRMSQELARTISRELTKKKQKEIDKMISDFSDVVAKEYEKQLPADVKRVRKLHPKYLTYTDSVYLDSKGFNRKSVSVSKKVVQTVSQRWNGEDYELVMDHVIADRLKTWDDEIKNREKAIQELRINIQAALIGLNTFAKIQKEFPEAVKYIPQSVSKAIMVNIEKVREEIKTA